MNRSRITQLLVVLAACWLAAGARADRIELTDGSVIHGKLVSADNGKFRVETPFAGPIEIGQEYVRTFSTDDAVNVSLAAGSQVLGRVEPVGNGVKISTADGAMSAETTKVVAVWRAGVDSPTARAAKAAAAKAARHWTYEASAAIAGRTGASEKISANLGFKATLASEQDKLVFALAAERAKDNGVDTANRQFGSVDYSSFFTPRNGWYVRSSLEKDEIKALDLRSTTAFGLSRKLIKSDRQDLEFRAGVNYLYESYANGTKFDSPGLDVGLLHSYQFTNAKLTNQLTYTPAFENFGNYRLHHESALELPLGASLWKLKTGVTNDYQSKPQPGIDRLDTLYFTSLILNWE